MCHERLGAKGPVSVARSMGDEEELGKGRIRKPNRPSNAKDSTATPRREIFLRWAWFRTAQVEEKAWFRTEKGIKLNPC